jgi:uncharacterized protein (TIGR02231 family)
MMNKNLLALAIAAMPLTAMADITQATLYPSHGDLTWQEIQTVKQGNGVITIDRLPVSLQDQSVQVSLGGVAGAQIQQIEIGRVEQTGYISEQTQRLRNELAQVLEQLQAQEDAIQAWNQQVTLMTKAAENPHELSATELSDMAAALKQTTMTALAEIRGIRTQMRDNIALKDRLERELSQAQQNARASKTAQIHYRAPAGGDLTITLEFQSNEARWSSEYNAQLNSRVAGQEGSNQKSGELTLQHLAVVQQTTGDDWSNVELQLSTANARRGTNMPALDSWVVSPAQPDLLERQMKSSALMLNSSAMAESQADFGASVERQSTFTQSYRLAQPVSVPSGSNGQRLIVAEHTVAVEMAVWTAPAYNPTGYVHATGIFTADAPIPAGPVQLFRDGQSVGSTYLPEMTNGEELRLGFGVDEAIRVAVINETERTGEEGIWKSEQVQRRQNRFEITNHHDEAVNVRIFDRMPVSQIDILTVEPLQISEPVERNVDDKKGVLAWNRTVPAGETVSVQSGFEVRVPQGKQLPDL